MLRGALRGRLRIGAIPTTLPALSLLTLPFSQLHPQVTISIYSLTSVDIQRGLDDFSLDAGLTYLDNEPLANVRTIPLYHERYLLFTPAGSPLADSETVSWGEVTGLPLCLLTPDMQNRRIIDGLFAAAGATVHPTIETNSVLTLWSHVRTGAYSSILSQAFLFLFGEPAGIRAIPITGSVATHSVGLVVSDREPLTPSARALAAVAATLDCPRQRSKGRRLDARVPGTEAVRSTVPGSRPSHRPICSRAGPGILPAPTVLLSRSDRSLNHYGHEFSRLTEPLVRENGVLRPASWDEALDRAAEGFRARQGPHGGDAIGTFSCSKASNEVNFLAQKLVRVALRHPQHRQLQPNVTRS